MYYIYGISGPCIPTYRVYRLYDTVSLTEINKKLETLKFHKILKLYSTSIWPIELFYNKKCDTTSPIDTYTQSFIYDMYIHVHGAWSRVD